MIDRLRGDPTIGSLKANEHTKARLAGACLQLNRCLWAAADSLDSTLSCCVSSNCTGRHLPVISATAVKVIAVAVAVTR